MSLNGEFRDGREHGKMTYKGSTTTGVSITNKLYDSGTTKKEKKVGYPQAFYHDR